MKSYSLQCLRLTGILHYVHNCVILVGTDFHINHSVTSRFLLILEVQPKHLLSQTADVVNLNSLCLGHPLHTNHRFSQWLRHTQLS